MKVSVLMTAYNQQAYISQAINSILMQEVAFDYELVIGEDASTDSTREIVLELQRKHPDKIRVLLRSRSEAERDRARQIGGKTSFMEGFRACRGQYIALLDGDDYWTSPHKLQKQVDYLDSQPEISLCFHDVIGIDERAPHEPMNMAHAGQKEISTLAEIATGNFILPCSVMFRNHLWENMPEAFRKTRNGDWMLFMLCAEHGKIGFINEVMAVYRIHGDGAWSKLTNIQQLKQHISTYELIDEHLKFKYHPLISKKISAIRERLPAQYRLHARSCLDRYHALARGGQVSTALPLLWEATRSAPAEVLRPRRFLAVLKNGFLGILHKESTQN
jgi:glycosyltransferase involved in cell wall biosynthesis